MPNARHFDLDTERYKYSAGCAAHKSPLRYEHFLGRDGQTPRITFGIFTYRPDGYKTVEIEPLPYPGLVMPGWSPPPELDAEHIRQACRGLYVFAHAASLTDAKIETLYGVSLWDQRSIPHQAFDMTPIELHHAIRACRYLKTVGFRLCTDNYDYANNPDKSRPLLLDSGHLGQMLSAAHGLEKLDLSFSHSYTKVRMHKLLGTATFPRLRVATFHNILFEADELLDFLRRHASSLRDFRIDCLWSGPVSGDVNADRRVDVPPYSFPSPVAETILQMSRLGLQLENLQIGVTAGNWHGYEYCSMDPHAIQRFFESGGTNLDPGKRKDWC